MRKSKRGTALFDLLTKDEDKNTTELLRVPGWWGRRAERVPPAAPPPPQPEPDSPAVPDAEEMASADGTPLLELDGDRIRISLTSLTAAVVMFAGLVCLLGAYELGRRGGDGAGFKRGYAAGRASYAASAVTEIEAARKQPPATHLIANLLSDASPVAMLPDTPAGPDATGQQGPRWIQDYTYVVAQEFAPGHEHDGLKAREFLSEHGIETELVRYPSGSIQLITLQGYNRGDPTQRRLADQLLQKVRTVGAKYFASGGGYRLEGYFKTFKGDRW